MFNIGPAELLIIGLVLLIAVGPEQLPSVIRRAGSTVAQFRSMTDGLRSEFMAGLDEIERATDVERWSDQDSDVGKGDAATRRSTTNDTSADADRSTGGPEKPVTGADLLPGGKGPAGIDAEPSEGTGDARDRGTDGVADTLFTTPDPPAGPGPASANGGTAASEAPGADPASSADAGEGTT